MLTVLFCGWLQHVRRLLHCPVALRSCLGTLAPGMPLLPRLRGLWGTSSCKDTKRLTKIMQGLCMTCKTCLVVEGLNSTRYVRQLVLPLDGCSLDREKRSQLIFKCILQAKDANQMHLRFVSPHHVASPPCTCGYASSCRPVHADFSTA